MDLREWVDEAARRRMPSLGHDDAYFLGSGIVGASGTPAGEWTFAIGPDYTCPNYLHSESVWLNDSGAIPFEMYRLRGCGAFFGLAVVRELRCTITDVCPPDSCTILRMVTLENEGNRECACLLRIRIVPDGETVAVGSDGLEIRRDAGEWCFGNQETHNWAPRRMRICVPGAVLAQEDNAYDLQIAVRLAPGAFAAIPIWHDFAYTEADACVQREEPSTFLRRAIGQWGQWLAKGRFPNSIVNRHLRDAVESLLLNVKMQQNRDGGMIAGIRKYANSYIRDSHGGMRLLNACGHVEETRKLLLNIHTRWERAGFIPNWWSMGSDTFIGASFNNDAAEITAYYIFMLRDYLQAGGDEAFAQTVLPSIRWAAEVQAEHLRTHDLLLDFNGDETEQYCVFRDGQEYGLFGNGYACDKLNFQKKAASFASTAAAVGSLEWFGHFAGEADFVTLAERVRAKIEQVFWNAEKQRHGWIYDANGLRDSFLTNASLLPLWLHISLKDAREAQDAIAAVRDVRPDTGYLPNCPGIVEGFCGHTLGMALYAMVALDRPEAGALAQTILHSNLLSRYGTVSEFYGPGGTPNGHGNRPFEGGIVGEALVYYAQREERLKCIAHTNCWEEKS